jgi:hypothetical protein
MPVFTYECCKCGSVRDELVTHLDQLVWCECKYSMIRQFSPTANIRSNYAHTAAMNTPSQDRHYEYLLKNEDSINRRIARGEAEFTTGKAFKKTLDD